MRTPAFWGAPRSWQATLLAPAGWIYGAITAWRMARKGERAAIPVICVGNFTAGGAGKTPTVIMLADALAARGEKPFIVSRGHGGRIAGPTRIDLARHTSAECGDEPVLLAYYHPVIVARDRRAGVRLAAAEGATLALLDDGLQNPALARDFTLAVVDAGFGVGNGACVPAGPLRAPVAIQLKFVDAVFLLGEGEAAGPVGTMASVAAMPVFSGTLEPNGSDIAALCEKPLLAFAGIGRPEKFFRTLAAAGLNLQETRPYPDHYPFADADALSLNKAAQTNGLTLVTTEKDSVRWPTGQAQRPAVVRVRAKPDNLGKLVDLISVAIRNRRSVT
ncbi:MAG: tetraacyldisaccharide 4'-kinase [Beijerinckiaceae bacterium]